MPKKRLDAVPMGHWPEIGFKTTNCRKYGTKYSRMDQEKFVEDSLQKLLLGPFLNALSHILQISSLQDSHWSTQQIHA